MNLDDTKDFPPVKPDERTEQDETTAPATAAPSAATALLEKDTPVQEAQPEETPEQEKTAEPEKKPEQKKKSPQKPKQPKKKQNSKKKAQTVKKGLSHGTIRRRNRAECKKVLARWHRRQKIEDGLNRLYKWWIAMPQVPILAEGLYMLGFWTQYALIRAGRMLYRALMGLGREVQRIILAVLRPLGRLLLNIITDGSAPLRDIARELRNTASTQNGPDEAGGKKKNRAKSRLPLYLPVLQKALTYVLPLCALLVFSYTIRSILASSFLLEVHVNGKIVGYVQSEQIFQGAKEAVQERIANAKSILASAGLEQSDEQWEISPTYTLATEATRDGRILSQNAMTDAILSASSDEITEGTAIYVDGSLLAILASEDATHLNSYLDNLRTEATNSMSFQALLANPDLSDVRIEFEHDIQHGSDRSGVYFTSTVSSYDSVLNTLNGSVTSESYYQAQSGDTVQSIAELYGATVEELYQLNPVLENGGRVVEVGDVITVPLRESLLNVEQKATVTWQETIDYDTVNQESDKYYWGDNRVEQEGSDGLKELTADIVFRDGSEVSRNVTGESVLIAPVTEVMVKGTKLPSGMTAQYGSGTFIWPVPVYTYVSRWMSSYHNGADICAAYGSPILASDSGVVITSDYHYSYGNYVVIDHGNGYRTLYAHMSQRLCSVGDAVKQGQQIGCIGSTGNSTGNHCHFEMYYNGVRFSAQSLFGGMR